MNDRKHTIWCDSWIEKATIVSIEWEGRPSPISGDRLVKAAKTCSRGLQGDEFGANRFRHSSANPNGWKQDRISRREFGPVTSSSDLFSLATSPDGVNAPRPSVSGPCTLAIWTMVSSRLSSLVAKPAAPSCGTALGATSASVAASSLCGRRRSRKPGERGHPDRF